MAKLSVHLVPLLEVTVDLAVVVEVVVVGQHLLEVQAHQDKEIMVEQVERPHQAPDQILVVEAVALEL